MRNLAIVFGLSFLVLSSKQIIVYNEEILVALTFTGFIWFVAKYYGKDIAESLDERASGIQTELERGLNLQQDFLNESLKVHQNTLAFVDVCDTLNQFVQKDVKDLQKSREHNVGGNFQNQIHSQLVHLSHANVNLMPRMQATWANGFRASVYEKVKTSKKSIHKAWIKQSVKSLKKLKKKK